MMEGSFWKNFKLGTYRFILPQISSFAEFDHGAKGNVFHFFFMVCDHEYRFKITPSVVIETPKNMATQSFTINAPFSNPDWWITPHQLENAQTNCWACGYGLMEGEGLRIYKVFFETGQTPVCLTFSAYPDRYNDGFKVFEKIAMSFSMVEPDSEMGLST